MGTQNILNYYGNRLDAKLSYDSYYDFYLASDEDNFQREVVYSDNIIGYTEPRTPQLGTLSNVIPLWIDLNNTASTIQPAFTGVSVVQQKSDFSATTDGTSASYSPAIALYGTGYPQSIISQNYWGQAYAYCDCPYEDCHPVPTGESGDTCGGRSGYTNTGVEGNYKIENWWLNSVDIGIAPYMYSSAWDKLRLWPENIPISGDTNVHPFGIFNMLNLDKRFKMWQVSANTQAPSQSGATTRNVSDTFFEYADSGSGANPGPEDSSKFNMNGTRRYTISSATDSSGYYQELNGGYYAGAYKFYGYPYSVLPDRPDEGWTMETFLKLRATGTTTGGTCFSTNYNLESNVRVNPGDGCYSGPPNNPTIYHTNPVWNTGITVTNSGSTLPAGVNCDEFLVKAGCEVCADCPYGYNCHNHEFIESFCHDSCQEHNNPDDTQCLCCKLIGVDVPTREPQGDNL